MQSATEFLTPAECAEVDQALLTAHDKFAARVAVYALRSLKQIAQEEGVAIEQLSPTQIEDWIYQDDSLQGGLDREFKPFFAQLVISSQKPLRSAAQEAQTDLEHLTLAQVIAWFEQEARLRLTQPSATNGMGKTDPIH